MTNSKILIVDHHAIHLQGRGLYQELAKTEGYTLRVIAPRVWREYGLTNYFDAFAHLPGNAETLTGNNARTLTSAHGTLSVIPSSLLFGGKPHRNFYCRLARELRTFRPDILLVNSEPEGFLACQAIFLCGIFRLETEVLFTTWRNMRYGDPGVPFPVKWPWLSRLIENYVLPRAAHGIAHSPSATGIFQSRRFNRMSYIPPWVDVERFSGDSGKQGVHTGGYATPAKLRVGFVGRLVREKGVDLLVKALQDAGFAFSLTIVGDGPEKGRLERLVHASGLSEHCTFLLPVPQDAIPDVMQRFDVLVLPSRGRSGWKEQFGRVLIEAMASGVVVIGSDSGDIPEVIGGAGCIFREEDSEVLRTILQRLAGDERLRQTYKEAGIRRVTDEYSLAVAVNRYRELFDTLKFKREIRTIDERSSK